MLLNSDLARHVQQMACLNAKVIMFIKGMTLITLIKCNLQVSLCIFLQKMAMLQARKSPD